MAVSDTLNGIGLLIVGIVVPILGLAALGKGSVAEGLSIITTSETHKLNSIGSATDPSNAPVRAAYRYLDRRMDQLDYHSAIERELPIGSGMIEGGHRHVLQNRLKLSGAWWKNRTPWIWLTCECAAQTTRRINTGKT